MIEDLYQQRDGSSLVNYSRIIYTYQSITKIEQLAEVIESFNLSNNYPNPFNPSTTIKYSIPSSSVILSLPSRQSGAAKNLKDFSSQAPQNDNVNVTLRVYDILGREVAILVNQNQKPGNYEITWNASSQPSGVYFYQLTAGEFVETKKLILMK